MTPLLFAVALSLAAEDPLATIAETEVTGWSKDETKFSVRAFDRADPKDEGEQPACPGYTDHTGQPFKGRLVLAAYDKGNLIESWLVQDYPTCTPAVAAKDALNAAKKRFAELGIDLKSKGKQLSCASGCDLGHDGASLLFEDATTSKDEDESGMSGALSGELRLALVSKAGKKTVLFKYPVNKSFTHVMGGNLMPRIAPVEVSATGKAVLVRFALEFTSMRGDGTTPVPAGFYLWKGDKLVKQ